MKQHILIFSFLATLYACNSKTNNNSISPIEKEALKILDSIIENSDLESISLGIVEEQKNYQIHSGILNGNNGKHPDSKTMYEIASITKTFTGTLLAEAINEGKISITDDIRKYLNDSFPNLEYQNKPISVLDIVLHKSGLPFTIPYHEDTSENLDFDVFPFEENKRNKDFSRSSFFNELKLIKLDTFPGTTFSYSSAGVDVLGYCLEQIYSQDFETLLKQKIYGQLSMKNTKIILQENDMANVAIGFNSNGNEMSIQTVKDLNAGSGIKTTTSDMIQFMKYHLSEDKPVIKLAHQELNKGAYGPYEAGFFWQIYNDKIHPRKIFQNGGLYGTSSYITLIPEQQIGIFIVTNKSGEDVHNILNIITDKIIGKIINLDKQIAN